MSGLGLGLGLTPRRRGVGTAVPVDPPSNVTAPGVTGTGYIGYVLTCGQGLWTGDPTYIFQWQRWDGADWDDIVGADETTYTVTLADEGVPVRCVVTATNIAGTASEPSNAIEQWVPSDAGEAPALWYDALDASTITIATGVSSWLSKGSVTESLATSTGANQPLYDATGWDGTRPALRFNGTSQRLATAGNADIMRNVTGGLIAVMGRCTSFASARAILMVTNNASVARAWGRTVITSGVYRAEGRRLDANSLASVSVSAIPLNGKASMMSCFNYGAAQAFGAINGLESTPGTFHIAGNTSDTASANRFLGATGTAADLWAGDMTEVLVYNILLDATQRGKLSGYLAWRWGAVTELDAGSPYKAGAPTP